MSMCLGFVLNPHWLWARLAFADVTLWHCDTTYCSWRGRLMAKITYYFALPRLGM
ncbi:hypothetical protein BJX99DRAFT_242836 [Aspergillus californicus]